MVFYIMTAPRDAAAVLHTAVGWLGALDKGLSDVVTETISSVSHRRP